VGRAREAFDRLLEIASVESVWGKPVRAGDRLLIPTAEVVAAGGFGAGSGAGSESARGGPVRRGGGGGGGGGGKSFSRIVAVVEVSGDGVAVRPVFDATKVILAALTAAAFVGATWLRMSRPKGILGLFARRCRG
jgi:uncharacterized spore protein YtfJ